MKYSNSIGNLYEILEKANSGNLRDTSGRILAEAMNSNDVESSILDFYSLLFKVEKDAKTIVGIEDLEDNIEPIIELQKFFVNSNLSVESWIKFHQFIKSKNIHIILKYLSRDFESQQRKVYLDESFIKELRSDFNDIREKVINSELSKDAKIFLLERIEELVYYIDRYQIYGSKDLEVVVQSTLWGFYREQKNISEKDKSNPILIKFFATFCALETIFSGWATTENFLIPKLENYTQKRNEIAERVTINRELPNISDYFNDIKSLPLIQNKSLKKTTNAEKD